MEKLEIHKFTEPCEFTKAQLVNHGSGRILSLGNLKTEFPKTCVWCAVKLDGRKSRWCSVICVRSAQYHCHPQSPDHKMHRLIFEQNYACKICGESFEEEINQMISKHYERINKVGEYHFFDTGENGFRKRTAEDPVSKVSLFQLGSNTGDRWHTDHIIPIHKGGKGIDPKNLQVVCVQCHKIKTKTDR